MKPVVSIMLCLSVILFTQGASLAAQQNSQGYGQGHDWSVRLGAMGLYAPEYEGSDDYAWQGFPLIDITWQGRFFINSRKGLGAYFYQQNDIKLGAAVGYRFGRDQDDSDDLAGLGDIDGGATGNLFFAWDVEDFSIDTHLEQRLTGADTGFQAHAGIGYKLRYGDKTLVRPSFKTTYSSSDYMQEYFGISSAQSLRSGLPVFDANAGFKSIGVQMVAIHSLDRQWGVQVLAGYSRLLGDAADSPVVKVEHQYLFGFGASYAF